MKIENTILNTEEDKKRYHWKNYALNENNSLSFI